MPELPEVETVRRGLEKGLIGRRILALEIPDEKKVRGDEAAFRAAVVGARFRAVERRAKYLIFRLDNGRSFIAHLRMSGQLIMRPAGAPPDRFTRMFFLLDEGELRFNDMRRFGFVKLVTAGSPEEEPELSGLGPEPFGADYELGKFYAALHRRRIAIKSALLDQRLVAGLGNIYADEVLFLARVRPTRRARSLTRAETRRIWELIPKVLASAVENGGSSIDDFVDASGAKGRHAEVLKVYGKTGQACPSCGTGIKRVRIGGRSSHYCARCQK